MEQLIERVRILLAPILSEENLFFVDLQIKGKKGNQIIKIFVDSASGITLDECEKISRKISDELELADIIPGKYRLEVSSPGVDRPLQSIADFMRNAKREVIVTYKDKIGMETFQGRIIDVSDDTIQLKSEKEIRKIHISKIINGKIKLPW